MSYPQPLASLETIEGSEFFRINTLLETAGDAYELDVSAKAFCIGPESDIARARVTYYDPSAPGRSSSFVVSVGDPFIGRIDAFSSFRYPVAGTPARIVVSLEDLYEPIWLPSLVNVGIVRIKPRLDLLAYLAPPSELPAKRSDFTTRGRLTIAGGTTGTYLICPYYGRKYASVVVTNYTGGAYTCDISGISFTTDAVTPVLVGGNQRVHQTAIVTAGAIAAPNPTTASFVVRASTNGLFDYLLIGISGAAVDGAATNATLSYLIRFTDDPL